MFGRPAPPGLLHLNDAVMIFGLFGVVLLGAAIANLVLGV